MHCNQAGCPNVAAFRFVWPGKPEAGICGEHLPKLCLTANALGLDLQIRAIERNGAVPANAPEKFDFEAPDCNCLYRVGIVARNMCGHVPPCPVYERWAAMLPQIGRKVQESLDQDTLRRALWARLETSRLSGEKLVEDYQKKVAETLLMAGITLIPSDHLLDHQYVVSRGVYEAAKKLAEGSKR